MYYHCIFMFSDYDSGIRKAYYKTFSDIKDLKEFRSETKQIKGEFKNVKFSYHQIMTNSKYISSVVECDKYFKGVRFYSEKHEFELELINGTKITSSDILKYILINKQCTKLKAMKLIYLVYEEYLKQTNQYLFEEEFLAWKLGPVAKNAYKKLSNYKNDLIKIHDLDIEKIQVNLKLDRIKDKDKIIECIDKVLIQYGDKSPTTLVEITHEEDRPWCKVKKKYGLGCSIPKELVKKYVMKDNEVNDLVV